MLKATSLDAITPAYYPEAMFVPVALPANVKRAVLQTA